ncbi:MAG TPA: 30S ribosomal protein S15 [Candidatus Nanoarchaeia archaeon]|nr:30S ribosomal protein S15 [Candidatus Nanoarchaeia archaeon]
MAKTSNNHGEEKKPLWVKMPLDELENLVADLAKQGIGTEKIGLILRDNYGIPAARVYGKSISKIISEKLNVQRRDDLDNVKKKIVKIKAYLAKAKTDKNIKRSLSIHGANAIKLERYYKKEGKNAGGS